MLALTPTDNEQPYEASTALRHSLQHCETLPTFFNSAISPSAYTSSALFPSSLPFSV